MCLHVEKCVYVNAGSVPFRYERALMRLRPEVFQESKYIKLYKHGCNLLFMSDY